MIDKLRLKKNAPFIILIISILIYILAIFLPGTLYPRIIYKMVSQSFSIFFSLLPFSFAELLLILFPLWCLYGLGKGVYLWFSRSHKVKDYWRRVIRHSWQLSCYLLSAFILFTGTNYHRKPLVKYVGLEVQPAQKEELKQMCFYLTDLTMSAAGHTRRLNDNRFVSDYSFGQKKQIVGSAYDSLATFYPVFNGRYPAVKPLTFSYWVSFTHILGFFFPFTFEVNINNDIPQFMIPAVMAHELAHVRGFMREEEAEYAVYLLARHTQDMELKYSFYLSTLMRSINVLYVVDVDDFKEVLDRFSDLLIKDMNDYANYWSAFQSPIANISQTLNDAYLKANSQSDGVQSYGRVVDLLIADYNTHKP